MNLARKLAESARPGRSNIRFIVAQNWFLNAAWLSAIAAPGTGALRQHSMNSR